MSIINIDMRTRTRRGFVYFIFIVILFEWIPVSAQSNQLYFPETGHTVSGEFLQFYEKPIDPLLIYGYPITESFQDPTFGRIVQYFQNARFEYYPDAPPGMRVKQSPLGTYLYTPGTSSNLDPNTPGCETFQEKNTSFQVCYAFLDFLNAYGGVDQFGLPISNLEKQEGRIVQYFQNARFEWHPQMPTGQRVKITPLGSLYFARQALDQDRLRQKDNLPQTVIELNVRIFPAQPVMALAGRQTANIIVQDQNFLPVAGASVSLLVRLPGGQETEYKLDIPTRAQGLARITFPFEASQPGMVTLQATARYGNLMDQAVNSFWVWR